MDLGLEEVRLAVLKGLAVAFEDLVDLVEARARDAVALEREIDDAAVHVDVGEDLFLDLLRDEIVGHFEGAGRSAAVRKIT